MNATNPLLDASFEIPFDRIRPEHIVPAVTVLLDQARADVDAICAQEGTRTWDDTLGALQDATEPLRRAWSVAEHLNSVDHSEALAEAYAQAQPGVTAFYASLALDERLYATVRAFADTPEAQALTGARRRHLDKTLDEFRRSGAELDEAGKARYREIVNELADLGRQFSINALHATAAWSLVIEDEDRLQGLPPSAKAMAKADAEAQGLTGWRLSLSQPSQMAVLTYADDRALREQVWRAATARCTSGPYDNRGHIARMLALRAEQARLLGYANFADYILEDRMAKSGAAADRFLADIEDRARHAFQAEQADLAAFAASELGLDALAPWDVSWVSERLRKARYDLDEEALRPYFAFDRVLHGLYDLVERLYGVTVEPAQLPVWHPNVRSWNLRDDTGQILGSFYSDFVPRTSKRQGAWMNPLLTGAPNVSGRLGPHLALICGNLTPPMGDEPALLSHREVETVFHEFGHLLHHLLTTVPIRDQAGTSVAWDFVELPSQVLENWTWERASIDLFARHHQTGEAIPEPLFERMTAARNFRAGTFMMRQLGFGRTDLALHTRYNPDTDGDPVTWGDAVMAPYTPVPSPEGHSILPTFQHLFAGPVGYAAGYYSYMWASVLDADVFTRFLERGLFDRETGLAFRNTVLSLGDSVDPAELFRAFMGRDPDPEAMLRRRGLA